MPKIQSTWGFQGRSDVQFIEQGPTYRAGFALDIALKRMERSAASAADFAEVARGYCSWCENPPSANANVEAAFWLGRLYSSALMLPKVSCENEDGLPDIPSETLARAIANLAPFSGWYYREVFDPHPYRTEVPGMGDIGDDLLDTYKDIRAGLVLFDRGEVDDALWHWSFLHLIHWGRHAVGAMYALHCLAISQNE
ncbi:MAG TPA: hypothetical protein DHV01_16680 [Rhodoferax sp.]|uniref:DUF5063 domain-containing protein n=1 Tax=Rhodoferax sp. TaxID=50421 RepID=UPI000EECB8C6|nr:DUF5063 domain-containing protein [Rhodoferax sp.]HCX83218.1 hypothetical protein [Rhodoferax sp.]